MRSSSALLVVPETPERLLVRRRSSRRSRNSLGEILRVTETPDGSSKLRSLVEESPGAGPSQEGLQERAQGVLIAPHKRRSTLAHPGFHIRVSSPTSEETFMDLVAGTQEMASTRLETPKESSRVQEWLRQGNELPSPKSILSPRKSLVGSRRRRTSTKEPKKENRLPPQIIDPSPPEATAPPQEEPKSESQILSGVLAHVDVLDREIISIVEENLESLGAAISPSLSKDVSHLIFKDGSLSVYNKAKALGAHIVSVGWIEACRKKGARLKEEDFPSSSKEKYDSPDMATLLKRQKTRRRIISLSTEEKYKRFVARLRRKKEKEELLSHPASPVKLVPLDFYNSPKYNAPRSIKSPKQKSVLDQIMEEGNLSDIFKTPPRESRRLSQESPTTASIFGDDFDTPLSVRAAREYYKDKRQSLIEDNGASPLLHPAADTTKEEDGGPYAASTKRKTDEKKKEDDHPSVAPKSQKKRYVLYTQEPPLPLSDSPSEPPDISVRPPPSVIKKAPKEPAVIKKAPKEPAVIKKAPKEPAVLKKPPIPINEHSARYNRRSSRRRSSMDFVRHITTATRREELSTRGKREVVVSSASADDLLILKQVIATFGFYLSKSVTSRTSHVICCSPGPTRRTLSVLRGLLRGCWIVSKDWMLSSLEEGYLLDEEPYERVDFSPAVQACRLERIAFGSYRSSLLAELGPIHVSRKSSFSNKDIGELIRLGGGRLAARADTAEVVVGARAPSTGVGVKEAWLMDSIQHNVLLPLDDYLLNSP